MQGQDPTQERHFQHDILAQMQAQGWQLGQSKDYDRALALYPEDALAFIQRSQPQQWQKLAKHYPDRPQQPNATGDALLQSLVRDLTQHGTLWVLRNQVKDRGAKFRFCAFRPDHSLNPETLARYQQNILRVVPELAYSPNGYDGRIDLTLFINGIAIATCELKSDFKQSLLDSKKQYMQDRLPKDPVSKKAEPLLTFKRGALVHFAVSQSQVAMTTRLAGDKTVFLPFNQGTADGGPGNDIPSNPQQYASAYLWQEIFQKDNLLLIVGRYIQLQVKEEQGLDGRIQCKETLIFPRYHQWAAVSKLLHAVDREGTGHPYLIQHSAGSGKSNSIAWLAHQLASKHYHSDQPTRNKKAGEKVFDSVIVITDRSVLDSQLQATISQFEHPDGMIAHIHRDTAPGSKSNQLASALKAATAIIIVTIQTFPHVLATIRQQTSLARRSYAVIADEAHSGQSSSNARQLREVLMSGALENDEESLSVDVETETLDADTPDTEAETLDAEDILRLSMQARKGSEQISYFAFTATPKAKTLRLFGRLPQADAPESNVNLPQPFHVYSMRQAIEEGFILDVLQHYTSYKVAYQLALKHSQQNAASDGLDVAEVDRKQAHTQLSKWVHAHPHNIAQKVAVIIEHFNGKVKHLLGGEAKAMVVTSSRLEAVRYKLAFDQYVEKKGYQNLNAMVAFSGEVSDPHYPDQRFTEINMNPQVKGQALSEAFKSPQFQVMLVANKFQTGFDQPKLVAMYVDKVLRGVECVQTLSRLNRPYPGKNSTFVLDFVNDPQAVLAEFKVYYQKAELENVSDPNMIYQCMDRLHASGIYTLSEVDAFIHAYHTKGTPQAKLANICQAPVNRYRQRDQTAQQALQAAQAQLTQAKREGNRKAIQYAQHALKAAKTAHDAITIFKKDLTSFVRYYEFISQVVDFDDLDLEKLCLFAKHLAPLLRQDMLTDAIDLSDVVMTHYRLDQQREADLTLADQLNEPKAHYLASDKISTGATPKDRTSERLIDILARMNELFASEGLSDQDLVNYANTIADKVAENDRVMDQLRNNSKAQAMLGQFPDAMIQAVIESMAVHQQLAMKVLADETTAKDFASLMFDLLLHAADQSKKSPA